MASSKTTLPYFMQGSYDSVKHALTDGIFSDIDKVAYIYIQDIGTLAYVDTEHQIHLIKGSNVSKVNALPVDGDEECLYIMNGVVYTYDGSSYSPTYKNIETELQTLKSDYEEFKEQVNARFEGLVDSETGEVVDVKNYVDTQTSQTVTSFQQYVDDSLQITII